MRGFEIGEGWMSRLNDMFVCVDGDRMAMVGGWVQGTKGVMYLCG
jgi:hypothetical protein